MKLVLAVLRLTVVSAIATPEQIGRGDAGATTATVRAQLRPTVEVVADLLDLFKAELVRDALSCEVRRPASAGGIKQDALFEHPRTPTRPARVNFQLHLPARPEN